MANTITKQTLVDGSRKLVVKVTVAGDNSGDESATQLIDMSAYSGTPDNLRIDRIESSLNGFACHLLWDATTDVHAVTIPDGNNNVTFSAPLINTKASGYTGDIMLSTAGLGTENGSFVLYMTKRAS